MAEHWDRNRAVTSSWQTWVWVGHEGL